MSIFEPSSSPWTGRFLSIQRVVAGMIYTLAGTMILFNFPPSPVAMPPLDLLSQTGIGGVLEVVGGVAIILGLFTRPVAFVLAGMMAVTYFQFHAPQSFFPALNGGIPAILFCFFYLYLIFAGAGPWSLDALIAKRRRTH